MRGMQVLVQVLLQELWEPTLWATCFATKPQDLRGAAKDVAHRVGSHNSGGAQAGTNFFSFFGIGVFFRVTYCGSPSSPYGGGASPTISGAR